MITSISHMFIFLSSTRRKTYRTRRVLVLDLEQVHGPDHGLHRHEDVLVDQLDVRPLLLVRKACSVDDLHLLDERRLARLPGACVEKSLLLKQSTTKFCVLVGSGISQKTLHICTAVQFNIRVALVTDKM